uniref:Uncharacterized protein n=1 Tax=Arundo donax TaxID=35708 RepID=A0A0A8ZTQ1_ARUDO
MEEANWTMASSMQ